MRPDDEGGLLVFVLKPPTLSEGFCLLGVPPVVAGMAQRYEVAVYQGKLRILVSVFDVVYLRGLGDPAIFPAVLAAVAVQPQDIGALVLPLPAFVKPRRSRPRVSRAAHLPIRKRGRSRPLAFFVLYPL